jgi:hypothetical protein
MTSESEQAVIRIRFVRHPGIFSALVQYAQFGFPQTHCEAVLPEGGAIGAWFKGGTQTKGTGYDAGEFSNELLFDIKTTSQQHADFYDFLIKHLYAPYDALAIVAFAAGRDWQEPDSWFCSEYLAAGLVAAGLFPQFMAARVNKVTVKDLALICAGLDHA